VPDLNDKDTRFAGYDDWLEKVLPNIKRKPFAARHESLVKHVWSIQPDVRPFPYVAIWPRGGGKTTICEAATVMIGCLAARRYGWYIQETQDQADKRIINIADMLETPLMEYYYPSMSRREVGKFGQSRGWTRNFLRTASGFVVEAVGLDKAARSSKVGDARPDWLIIDDIDGKHDSVKTVTKKIETLTRTLLPAASNNAAVMFVQNLIHPNSIASQLVDGRAEFLLDRTVNGPHKAVDNLVTEIQTDPQTNRRKYVIMGGSATWEGQSIEDCQNIINRDGLTSFKQESQHEVKAPPGGIWNHIEWQRCTFKELPDLVYGSVWCDPAVTSTDDSDSMGIQADGVDATGTLYRLFSWESITTPDDVLRRAILKAVEYGFSTVGVETDQGGDTWESIFEKLLVTMIEAGEIPENHGVGFAQAKAGAGHGSKVHRSQQMLHAYERGEVIHVIGTTHALESALERFPKTKPFDLADAAYWGWYHLLGAGGWAM